MRQSITPRVPTRTSGSPTVEGLEDRRLMAASPVSLSGVRPGKVLAGNTAYETVVVRNRTTAPVTEDVTVTLAPSLDGLTAAGSYGGTPFTQSVTLKKRGATKLRVPFVPPATLAAGRYHTLATVTAGADTVSATAPGTYLLTLPPAPTTTPSLVGDYSGLIRATSSSDVGLFGTNTRTKLATFIWHVTEQSLTTLTGQFSVGSGTTVTPMTGEENTTGAITFALTSDNITYTITGKVTPDGSKITGKFKGTLVNNIFKTLNGTFKITRQTI